MTELVETEEEYVKKLGHVCEVSIHPNAEQVGVRGGVDDL